MQNVAGAMRRTRSYTFVDVATFLLNFAVPFLFFAGSLHFSRLLSLPEGQPLPARHWSVVIIGGLVSVLFTYVRERLTTRSKEQRIKGSKIVYDRMGGAIEQLVDLEGRPSEERRTIPSDLLKYVEKIASQVLQDHGMKPGEMCANLTIKRVGADFLHITHFGTRLTGRSKRALPIDYGTPSPGAVEAYVFHSVAYVNDTHAEKFKQHFDQKRPYRAILSMPVPPGADEVFAVVKLDSEFPDQFGSKEFVERILLLAVNPLLCLVSLVKADIVPTADIR
jgi:hypothetical protein